MPRDDFPDRLRAALEGEQPTNEDEPRPTASTPLAQLRHLAQHAESETVRLRATQLLLKRGEARKDQRELAPDFAESYADDPARLARLVELHVEYGFFDDVPAFQERVESRAREMVEERAVELRAQIAPVGAPVVLDEPEAEEPATETPGPSATPRDAKSGLVLEDFRGSRPRGQRWGGRPPRIVE